MLWRPAVQELARPDDDPSLIFIAQRALAAVEDHLVSAPHEALLGFLVVRVFETPETGMPYVIVHGAVRVPQMIVDGASERVVAQALAAAQRMLPPEDGVVVGWYRSDPTGVLKISPDDHLAHVRHFPGPWQVVLLMTIRPSGNRGRWAELMTVRFMAAPPRRQFQGHRRRAPQQRFRASATRPRSQRRGIS